MNLRRKRLIIFTSVLIFIIGLTFLIAKLGSGYRPDFSQRQLRPTGLLVATSIPDGGQIWLNNKLKSATNTTLSLTPGEYEVEIKKDGFTSWKKKLAIKKEIVTKTDAYLFSTYPDLKALTFTGATNPLLSPDGQKAVFSVATGSANKRGLWILDLTDRPLGFSREPRQILESPQIPSKCRWSADSKQLIITLQKENYLLDTDRLTSLDNLTDITSTLNLWQTRWEKEEEVRSQAQKNKLPEKLTISLQAKIKDLQFSPDETKIIYTATASASIPEKIISALPGASTQKEEREIKAGKMYVYDFKEDKNFKVSENEKKLNWFPSSKHLLWIEKDKIKLLEYDDTNQIDLYSGPFENSFAFAFPAGNRLLILASVGKDTPANLYAVSLR